MTEWYRNTDWSQAIEADFDARLARSRSQKAQYLRIQGSTLKDSHPEVAVRLLARCIELGDEFHVAAAFLDQAHAYYRIGDLDQTLASLESAIEQQERHPMFRTSAPFDYAMLVALHERSERYDRALAILDRGDAALFAAMDFQRDCARALIYAARGRTGDAREAARRALEAESVREEWIPGHPDVGVVPNTTNPFSERLREIVSG